MRSPGYLIDNANDHCVAAQKSDKQPTSSNSWVLVSTLPEKFRDIAIIPPPRVPSAETESQYVGLYSFIISVIALAGGTLPEAKLERYLRRANADNSTPIDKTDKLLARLQKEGYIVKVTQKDSATGEESIEYMVGPRGKMEIGDDGVVGLVKKVYGEEAPDDLDGKLERSLDLGRKNTVNGDGSTTNGTSSAGRKRKRGRPRKDEHDEDEEDEDESEDDEEEDDGT